MGDKVDERALIAAGIQHDDACAADHPPCTCNGGAWCEDECPARPWLDRQNEANKWFEAHRRALLDGYSGTLDECERRLHRLDAMAGHMVGQIEAATSARDKEFVALRKALWVRLEECQQKDERIRQLSEYQRRYLVVLTEVDRMRAEHAELAWALNYALDWAPPGSGKAERFRALLDHVKRPDVTQVVVSTLDHGNGPEPVSQSFVSDSYAASIPPSVRVGDPGPCTPKAHTWKSGHALCQCGDAQRTGNLVGWRVASRLTDEEIRDALDTSKKTDSESVYLGMVETLLTGDGK